jgi:hypothetical protein
LCCLTFCRLSEAASSDSDDSYDNVYPNPGLTDLDLDYRRSLMSVGSAAQIVALAKSSSSQASKPKRNKVQSALISAEDPQDDWLVNDIPAPAPKRKRRDRDGFLSTNYVRNGRRQKREKRQRVAPASSESDNESGLSRSRVQHSASEREETASPIFGHSDDSVPFMDVSTKGDASSGSDSEEVLPVLSHKNRLHDAQKFSSTQIFPSTTQDSFIVDGISVTQGSNSFIHRDVTPATQGTTAHRFPRMEADVNRRLEGTGSLIGAEGTNQMTPVAASPSRPSRVKVRIEGSVFLVPITSM